MTVITIPKTIDEVVDRCTTLEGIALSAGWERAAIVWAYTEKGTGFKGNQHSGPTSSSGTRLTIDGFAALLGIPGLKSPDTVRRYHDAWQKAIDDGEAEAVQPGDEVQIPDSDWPPRNAALTQMDSERAEAIEREANAAGLKANAVAHISTQPGAIAAAIKADPKIAAAARRALDEDRNNRDLDAVARGGKVRSLDGINSNVGNRQLDGMLDPTREDNFKHGLMLIARGKAVLDEVRPLTEEEHAEVRAAALSLLDLIPENVGA